METSAWRLFVEGQLRGLLGGVVVVAVGMAVRTVVPVDTWRNFFGAVFITMAVAAPVMWLVALAPDDRTLVRSLVGRLVPAWRPT